MSEQDDPEAAHPSIPPVSAPEVQAVGAREVRPGAEGRRRDRARAHGTARVLRRRARRARHDGEEPVVDLQGDLRGRRFQLVLPLGDGDGADLAALNLQQTLIITTPLILTGLAVAFAFRCGCSTSAVRASTSSVPCSPSGSAPRSRAEPVSARAVAIVAGARLRRPLGGHRRFPEGDGRSPRGHLDDHAQLDRDLDRALPVRARRAAPERSPEVRADLERHRPRCQAAGVLGRPHLFQGLHIGFFIAIGALVVYWLILSRTTLGYGVKAVGFNPEAARYGGISVPRNYFLAMAISGAFAGLAGAIDILGWQFRLATGDVQASTIAFVGIAVALLGRNTAVGIALASLLFAGLLTGTSTRNLDPEVFKPELASNLTLLIQGLVVLFVGADVIVLWLMARVRGESRHARRRAATARSACTGAAPRPPARRVDRHRARPHRRLDRACRRSRRARGSGASSICLVSVAARHRGSLIRGERRFGGFAIASGLLGFGLAFLATMSGVGKLETVVVWSALFASMLRFATPLIFAAIGGMFSRALRRREHRPRGDAADRRLLRHPRRRPDRPVVARPRSSRCSREGCWPSSTPFFSIHLRADQIIGGTAINFLALGLTGYLYIDIYGQQGTPADISTIPEVNLGFLDGVAVLRRRLRAPEPDDLGRPRSRSSSRGSSSSRRRWASGSAPWASTPGRRHGRDLGLPRPLWRGGPVGDAGRAAAAPISRSASSTRSTRT